MGELQLVDLDGRFKLWAPDDFEARWQYEEIFDLGCYDDIVLPENAVVIDVGANIGLFSAFVLSRQPNSRIHAFEPMPEAARALRMNVHMHNFSNVRITECALGPRHETGVEFTYYPNLPGNSTRYPEEKELQKAVMLRTQSPEEVERKHAGMPVVVPVDRLSSFLTSPHTIDLLKIDVEGAELDVLRGISTDHWALIQQIVLEVQDLDGRVSAVVELLDSHGFASSVKAAPLIPEDIRTFVVVARRGGDR